jgi:hypothetical protein
MIQTQANRASDDGRTMTNERRRTNDAGRTMPDERCESSDESAALNLAERLRLSLDSCRFIVATLISS